jgi:ribosome-associated translation inhibitor RaiA
MRIAIASPGIDLSDEESQQIERDLDKVGRRLTKVDDVSCEVRVNNGQPAGSFRVVIELHYRANRLVATEEAGDIGMAIRAAREDILRQINDRTPRGHADHSKNG